ncbi:hypothetical protein D030_0036B, partial [Vibrio parahaemolyticus AQ3810]
VELGSLEFHPPLHVVGLL